MKFQLNTSLSVIINVEGGVAALDKFVEFGNRVWSTRYTTLELPGTARTLVPLSPAGEEVEFKDRGAMVALWGDTDESGGRGASLLQGEGLSSGDEYPTTSGALASEGDIATWSGRFSLRWANINGGMIIAVDLVTDEVFVSYDGQRGTLVGYECAGGSPVLMPLARILLQLLDDGRAELVYYETSGASREWSPFSIEADHRPLWQEAYGGMPSRLWDRAFPLIREEFGDCPESPTQDWIRLAQGMRRFVAKDGGGYEEIRDGYRVESYHKEVFWAFSEEAVSSGRYLSVDIETGEVWVDPWFEV